MVYDRAVMRLYRAACQIANDDREFRTATYEQFSALMLLNDEHFRTSALPRDVFERALKDAYQRMIDTKWSILR
jgi:hypothetical protein